MEKKEPIKISLPVFITIIISLVAVVYGMFMYMQNEKLEEEIASLRNEMNQTQVEKNELQEKLNSISNIASTETKSNDTVSTTNVTTNSFSSENKVLEEANITSNVNKSGSIGKTTYEIENVATDHIDGFNVSIENSKVYFELTDKEKIKSYAIAESTIKREENKKEEITGFSGKVKKVYFYQVGHDVNPSSLAILFLMEDGKIEYISYADVLQTNNLSSRGEITGLYNITEIYSAAACEWVDETGGPGWNSCVAKDSKNNYYSLEIAFEKNNIDLSKVK